MRLATFIAPGTDQTRAGEVRDGSVYAFAEGETVLSLLQSGRRDAAQGPSWPLSEVQLLEPIPLPRRIFCLALNYARHAAEGGRETPSDPSIFTKPDSASAPPSGPIQCPDVVRRLDYEAELAVVLGPEGSIAGYAVANDVSGRDLQKREKHWTRAKGADTFCPWGPWITTADEVANPDDLRVRCWVNGELRQDGTTADMIFSTQRVIEFLSETTKLRAGDLILTGTPEGVGFAMDPPQFLKAGDTVRIEIEDLGWIEHPVVGGPK